MNAFFKHFKYILIFILFFSCIQFFYGAFRGDYVYNYGFSYALSIGEIPFKDFNMIIPPFGALIYSIPMLILGNSNVVFNLSQGLLMCILFYFLFKMYDKKAYIFIPILCMCYPIPFATLLFPGYNFLLLLELVILLYLEKHNGSDYLIGIILGLSILTKQTVGFCLLLVSVYYLFKNYKKFFKRILGFCIPCFIFLIYSFITNTFYSFFDMCLFGMFDFVDSNGKLFDYNIIFFIMGVIYLVLNIIKDKKNINSYYVLAFSTIAIPLFDYYHVTIFLFSVLFIFLNNINVKYSSKAIFINSMIFTVSFVAIWYGFYYNFKPNFTNYHNFYYFTMNKKIDKETNKINNYIKKNKDKNIIILGANAYFFKITNDMEINHYDLLNYGNHGYNGTNKVINRIKTEKEPIFVVNIKEYEDHSSDRQQINKKVIKYVLDNYKEVERIGEYVILSEVK